MPTSVVAVWGFGFVSFFGFAFGHPVLGNLSTLQQLEISCRPCHELDRQSKKNDVEAPGRYNLARAWSTEK